MDPMINIFHIEDNPPDTEVILAKLKEAGLVCRITRIQTCAELETALRKDEPDIILAEYKLPMCNGMSALRLAQELHPEVPFIFVSSTQGEEPAVEALTQGATDYVLKQNTVHLESAVKRALKERQKRMEAKTALKASETKYIDLYENAPDMYVSVNAQTASIEECNQTLANMLQRPKEEIIGRPIFEIYHPDCLDQAKEVFREFLEQGEIRDREVQLLKKDRSKLDASLNMSAVRAEDGTILTIRSTLRDITKHKQMERELILREREYSTLVKSLPDFIVRYDLDLQRTYVNPAWEKTSGLSAVEIVNVPHTDIPKVPSPAVEKYVKKLRQVLKTGVSQTIEFSLVKADGEELILNYVIVPEYDNQGRIAGVLAIGRDITEQKRAEQERQVHLRFFENLDRVNRAIQRTNDLEQMMQDLLDVVLLIFDCDRAFLLYPCDPESSTWSVPMERNKPEYPGILDLKLEMPMDPQVAETLRILLAADGPVAFSPGTKHAPPEEVSEQFGFKCFMSMAIYPKIGSPWQFGIHQCTHVRTWTAEEKQLFQEIGRRLGDGLTTLLSYRYLRKNEKFLENIVEHIPNMIFVKDAQTLSFVKFNKAYEKLLGYSQEELLGKTDYDFFTKEEADFFTAKDRQVLESKELVDIPEEILKSRNNEERILHTKKIPILDETGTPQYLLSISEDITERKQAEEKMLRSDQHLRLHQEMSPLGFLEWDENFRAVEWNAACERIFGYTREEAIGRHAKDLILPEEVHELVDGIYQNLMNQSDDQHSINKNVTKDGRSIICEWFNTTLVDKDGKAIGVASVCNDITTQKQAEESIRKLSQAIEQSPVSILITDTKGSIEFVNAKFTQVTGYTYAEALGQNPRIFKSGETPSERYRRLWQTISLGGIWQGEFHNRKKNGELFWEYATIAPVKNADGVITNYVAVKEDITERKKLEEQIRQTQKLEAVGQLAGGVAHDFNNMLGVIIGYTEMALMKVANDDALREDLEQIKIAGHYSAEITRQLLAFARKQTIMPKILNLNKIVESMLKLLRPFIGEDIDFAWHPGENLWAVKIDPSQIDQILANLCVNAKDAIAGVGKITIETQNVDFDKTYCAEHKGFFPGEYIMLAVSDDGSGMDKQTLGKIFEPFFTTKGMGRGTGLGLATVYGIVKQNAGFINVYSEPGDGTTFKIYLPRHASEAKQVSRETHFSAVAHGSETILLVEDDTFFLGMVRKMLKQFGYKVLATSAPVKAITIASENYGKIDLLLTDVIMPEMTGRDLEKKLKVLCPGIKCLFMSGYAGNAATHRGVMEEDVNFIQKPFLAQELGIKVREILDRQ